MDLSLLTSELSTSIFDSTLIVRSMDDEGRKRRPLEIQDDIMYSLDFFIILNKTRILL